MKHFQHGFTLAAFAIGLSSAPAAAAAVCQVSSQSVSFGSYDTLSSASLDSVGNINVTCDVETSFTVSLGTGGGSYSERQMTSGSELLAYNLYTDPTRLVVWGDGTSGTNTVSGTATITDLAVYGRMPAQQNVSAGTYADTVVVTVTY